MFEMLDRQCRFALALHLAVLVVFTVFVVWAALDTPDALVGLCICYLAGSALVGFSAKMQVNDAVERFHDEMRKINGWD